MTTKFGGIIISEDNQNDVWVKLYGTVLPRLFKYHKKNKKTYSKDMEIVLSDTVDMLIEEILEQKIDNQYVIIIDDDLWNEIENIINYKHELLDNYSTVNDYINCELESSIECFKEILKLK